MNNIVAVVVTYNPDEKLYRNIQSYIDEVEKVVIIDNGSSDIHKINIEHLQKNEKIEVLFNEDNLGIATALNQGIKWAKMNNAKYIITFDQDSLATKGMVNQLLSTHKKLCEEIYKLGFVGPSFIEEKYASNVNKSNNGLNVVEVDTLITSGSLCDISLFDEVGLFKDGLFIDYVDHEYCLNAMSKGYKNFQDCNALLIHNLGNTKVYKLFKGISIKSSNHSSLRRYYMSRNRLYVYKEYFSKYPKWVLNDLLHAIREIIKIILVEQEKRKKLKFILMGIVDFMKERNGKIGKEI